MSLHDFANRIATRVFIDETKVLQMLNYSASEVYYLAMESASDAFAIALSKDKPLVTIPLRIIYGKQP